MGLAGKMKQKFSLSALPSKSQASSPRLDYDPDSPPYSPTASEMERPTFTPNILRDLKAACTILVNETNPPDPDDEPDMHETLRKVEAERKARYVAAQARAADAKSQKGEVRELRTKAHNLEEMPKEIPKRYSTNRPKEDTRKSAIKPTLVQPIAAAAHSVYKPATGIAPGTSAVQEPRPRTTGGLGISHGPEPGPTVTVRRPRDSRAPADTQDAVALDEIRRSIHSRPKTSAAACVDYEESPVDGNSSKSTSRSTSNFDSTHRRLSTGLTSVAQTPGEEKRRSHFRRPSDESYQEQLAVQQAEVWRREEVARQQTDQQVTRGRDSRPASRASKMSKMGSRSDSVNRPPSRASTIASSIADGISHYIRPRASSDSMRSGRSSALGFSRSHSRSSSVSRRPSSGFWRRGSLRRKGSWASFRSARGDQEEKRTKRNGEPNLNRPLPALPGLDQYREAKTHIGQMMKSGSKGRKKINKKNISEPQPSMPLDMLYVDALPKPATPILDRAVQQEETRHHRHSRRDSSQHRHEHRHGQHEKHRGQARRSTVPKNMESSSRERQRQSSKDKKRSSRELSNPPRRSTAPTFTYGGVTSDEEAEPSITIGYVKPSLAKVTSRSSFRPLSPTTTKASQTNNNLLHNAPPIIIRGPSYRKELESGVYPRPMEVNTGRDGQFPDYNGHYDVRVVDARAPSSKYQSSQQQRRKRESEMMYDMSDEGRWYSTSNNYAHSNKRTSEAVATSLPTSPIPDGRHRPGTGSGSNASSGKLRRMFGSAPNTATLPPRETGRRAVAAN